MKHKKYFLSIYIFVIVILLSCNHLPKDTATSHKTQQIITIIELAQSINQRLSYMKDVAAYKWERKIPIEDLEREVIVIKSSQKTALGAGLDSVSIKAFFELQIELAKVIQSQWHQEWNENGFTHTDYQDLTTEVRPELIKLGDQILKNINEVKPWLIDKKNERKLQSEFAAHIHTSLVSNSSKKRLFNQILRIKPKL